MFSFLLCLGDPHVYDQLADGTCGHTDTCETFSHQRLCSDYANLHWPATVGGVGAKVWKDLVQTSHSSDVPERDVILRHLLEQGPSRLLAFHLMHSFFINLESQLFHRLRGIHILISYSMLL